MIKYWPTDKLVNKVIKIEELGNNTLEKVVNDLFLDTEYNFEVTAVLNDGKLLSSEVKLITTPAKGKKNFVLTFKVFKNFRGKM